MTANWCFPNRVAYVVNHSFPYCSDGYAVRTHEVARALGALGHDVLVINRPGRPWDIEGFDASDCVAPSQMVDGVRYLFLPFSAAHDLSLHTRLRQSEKALAAAFEVFRPGAVLAASNWENAEPALYAARRCGAPFFYEQRGFWELSQAAQDPDFVNTTAYETARAAELRVAQGARTVFTLNEAMRAEIAARGVPEGQVKLVPNGITPPDAASAMLTREALGITARYVIGYVGSLSSYEGRDDLLEVLRRLRAQDVDVALLVVGSDAPKGLILSDHAAPGEQGLLADARKLGLEGHVHVTGQVPPAKVGAYYRLLDAMVMPRQRTPVTERVAPLKPYAAAAYKLPVFMPDLPPLVEVARDINGSIYPEGDLHALTTMLRATLLEDDHPARSGALPDRVAWTNRVQPLSKALRAAAEERVGPHLTYFAEPEGNVQVTRSRFDTQRLPRVALRKRVSDGPVCAIGPCAHLPADTQVIRLSRANILSELATRNVGCFMIDWRGLQETQGEWSGLWSIENMRLNRLLMDACAIAQDRGWRCMVVGPIARSRAPLYRTVAALFEEVQP